MSKYRRTSPFRPFSCAAQAHIRVSVQGGAKQKRVPFSRPGEAGAMAETTGGRRPAPLVVSACWMRVLCPMLRKGGRTSGCGGARRFAGCAVRRSKALSGTVYGHI